MGILIITNDELLCRMLTLELKRQGIAEQGKLDLCLVDLDRHPLPLHHKGYIIGLSRTPEQVDPPTIEKLTALLSLPFSARALQSVLMQLPHPHKDTIEITGHTLRLNGSVIHLSDTETALLRLLYDNRHRAVTNEELNALLGDSATHTNTLAVFMHRLRRKLSQDGVQRIKTLRQKGYQWIENEVTV